MGKKEPGRLPPSPTVRLMGKDRMGWLDEMLDTHPTSDAGRAQAEHDKRAVAEYRRRMEEGTLEYTTLDKPRW